MKYGSHKYTVPQGVTLYKVRLYLGKGVLRILLGILLWIGIVVEGIWLTIKMPNNLVGPYFLLQVIPMLFWIDSTFTLYLKNCQIEFLGEEKPAERQK